MSLRSFYLIMCVVGTAVPWYFFGSFFAVNGADASAFLRGLFANGAAAGFSTDVLVSLVVFWVWSFVDARERRVGLWWVTLPAGCLVGLSLALPLYLYLRIGATRLPAV